MNIPRSRHAALAVFALTLSPILSSTALAQSSATAPLAKIRDAWVQDLHTKQLDPILKFYSPDAVFHQPTGDRLVGSAALRTLFQNVMSMFDSGLTLHSQNLEASGDLGYDSGDYQEVLTTLATGAKIYSKGSYLIIFKRQSEGSWKIIQQVFTGIPPAGT